MLLPFFIYSGRQSTNSQTMPLSKWKYGMLRGSDVCTMSTRSQRMEAVGQYGSPPPCAITFLSICWVLLSFSIHHKWPSSVLWSLSWLSSFDRMSPAWWPPDVAIPESSEGSKVPFFTLTSSFSLATAPCWPPLTRFHFILRFWNHTFTWNKSETVIICKDVNSSYAFCWRWRRCINNEKSI